MLPTADLILFGVRGALRLRDQYRRGLADATLNLSLVLPLPKFPAQPDDASARSFYLGEGVEFQNDFLNEFSDQDIRISTVLNANPPAPEQKKALLNAFSTHYAIVRLREGSLFTSESGLQGVTSEDISALLALRQWRSGADPNPSLLRRMAGTLVNLAVDYLENMPGVLSETSSRGKVVRGFLEGIDSLNFAEAGGEEILTGLFSATLEVVRDHPELVAHGSNSRELVKQAAGGVFEDAKKFLKNGTQRQKDSVGDWANLVFRSVLNTAGNVVAQEPHKYLGLPQSGVAEELVRRVGKAVLSTVIDEDFLKFERLFTPEAVDKLVKAALTAAGNHPEILGADNQGIRNIVTTVAKELAQSTTKLGSDFLLETARLVIEKSGENLEQLMPGGVAKPAQNLLLVSLRSTLEQLSAPAGAGAKWKLEFGAEDAKQVAASVIDSVVQNPAWVESGAAGLNTRLGEVVKAVLDTVRAIAPEDRINRPTVIAIVQSALQAATLRLEFTTSDQNRMLVALAIDAVLSPILAPGVQTAVKWALLRDEVIRDLVKVALAKLTRFGVTPAQIQKLRQSVSMTIQIIAQGGKFSVDDFAAALDVALA